MFSHAPHATRGWLCCVRNETDCRELCSTFELVRYLMRISREVHSLDGYFGWCIINSTTQLIICHAVRYFELIILPKSEAVRNIHWTRQYLTIYHGEILKLQFFPLPIDFACGSAQLTAVTETQRRNIYYNLQLRSHHRTCVCVCVCVVYTVQVIKCEQKPRNARGEPTLCVDCLTGGSARRIRSDSRLIINLARARFNTYLWMRWFLICGPVLWFHAIIK